MKTFGFIIFSTIFTSTVDLLHAQSTIAVNGGILPVIWGHVDVLEKNEDALLKWTTVNEENTVLYNIQHSKNGRDWSVIGQVPATGNSKDPVHYQYLHNGPSTGINYYRVLQQDAAGTNSYSRVVWYKSSVSIGYQIFPNPTESGTVQVRFPQETTLRFHNRYGLVAKQVQIKPGNNSIDISDLPKGVYVLAAGNEKAKLFIR